MLPICIVAAAGPSGFVLGLAAALALALAAIHLFADRLLFLDVIPRSRWLSLAGGAAVSYVFVHVLPEIERAGRAIERSGHAVSVFDQHVYLVALAGFVAFYGLEQLVNGDTNARPASPAGTLGVFWLHIGSFALYNALIGYLLLHREETGLANLLLYATAMGLHFFVNDYGLRAHHGQAYDGVARWILAGSVVVGFVVGALYTVSELLLSFLFAFLAGGVILNVIKEELPAERESRFWAFAGGVVGYAGVLVLV